MSASDKKKTEKADAPVQKEGDKQVNGTPAVTEEKPGLPEKELRAIVEAILFASEEPLNAARIRDVAPELAEANVGKLIRALNKTYEKTDRPFLIDNVAGGYLMYTKPEFASYVERLYAKRQANRLSAKALETLAIIAYKQPITKNEMEEIRGVNVDGVVKTLLLRNLVTISGTADSIGNPFLYKTTRQFLEYFGLKSLKELPRLKELDEVIESDPDLKEKVGEEILQEIAPAALGIDPKQLKENGEVAEGEEKQAEEETQAEAPEDSPEAPDKGGKSDESGTTDNEPAKATGDDTENSPQEGETPVNEASEEAETEDEGDEDETAADADKA